MIRQDDLPDLRMKDPDRDRLIAGLVTGGTLLLLDVALLIVALVLP